jgi:hypothetical protein
MKIKVFRLNFSFFFAVYITWQQKENIIFKSKTDDIEKFFCGTLHKEMCLYAAIQAGASAMFLIKRIWHISLVGIRPAFNFQSQCSD